MAITVIRSYFNDGAPADRDVYAEGGGIVISDSGFLLVKGVRTSGSAGETLGIYAPGHWVQAWKNDAAVYTRG